MENARRVTFAWFRVLNRIQPRKKKITCQQLRNGTRKSYMYTAHSKFYCYFPQFLSSRTHSTWNLQVPTITITFSNGRCSSLLSANFFFIFLFISFISFSFFFYDTKTSGEHNNTGRRRRREKEAIDTGAAAGPVGKLNLVAYTLYSMFCEFRITLNISAKLAL